MRRSRLDAQPSDSDSSEAEDLPVFDFLKPTRSQADHSRAEPAQLVVLDSSDSESLGPPSPVSHQEPCPAVPERQGPKVLMVSSDSEEEEASVPLALRLKQRLGNPVTSTTAAHQGRPQHPPSRCPDVSVQPHCAKSSSDPTPAGEFNTPLLRNPEADEENEGPKGSAAVWRSAESFPWTEGGVSPPKKKVAKRTPAEIEAARQEALRKRAVRQKQQMDKEERRLELERQRAEKKALADAVKALRPEECIKHIVVSVDPGLLQLEGGGALLTSLQAMGCSCAIESHVIPCSITWARRTPSTQTGEVQCVPESQAVINVPVEDFIAMTHSYSQVQRGNSFDYGPTLTAWTLRLLARSPGLTLSLVVIDLEKYFRSQKSQAQKRYRKAVLGEEQGAGAGAAKRRKKKEEGEQLPEVSRVEVEEALVDLQLHTGVQVHFLPTWKEFTDYITMSTKAVAEAPFKRDRDRTGFSFCLESEWAGGQKVDRGGKGLLQVWKRQIQQLNRVSADIASAILAAYPSPQLLAQAYDRCRSEREKVSLLSDILIRRGEGVTSTTRRVGPELSKRVFLLMTSTDPNQVLDSTGD
ncbi:crossover junction endonuclease EME1 [Megalops cyprinoides]|uniref:crossover junction endonuclease EME1 n=1 Tax=Megalops cyprinoides TaxID=118141 RepID=UPI0018646A18|nr:crossover junction endonuclease EME1 [Megalops cyprinoides]